MRALANTPPHARIHAHSRAFNRSGSGLLLAFDASPWTILRPGFHVTLPCRYPLFPGENEAEQLACIMEVLGVPSRAIIEQSSRRKMFFDSAGNACGSGLAEHWGWRLAEGGRKSTPQDTQAHTRTDTRRRRERPVPPHGRTHRG